MQFVKLKYNNKEYTCYMLEPFTSRFWWEEGNGACDCNRILQIAREYSDVMVKDAVCGNTIELLDYELEYD